MIPELIEHASSVIDQCENADHARALSDVFFTLSKAATYRAQALSSAKRGEDDRAKKLDAKVADTVAEAEREAPPEA